MISEALANGLKDHGGEVRLSAPVRKVIVSEGQAIGVELVSGETLYAPVIVANTDPKLALTALLDSKDLADGLRAKAEKIDQRGSMARIHLLGPMPCRTMSAFRSDKQGPHHEGLAILGGAGAV